MAGCGDLGFGLGQPKIARRQNSRPLATPPRAARLHSIGKPSLEVISPEPPKLLGLLGARNRRKYQVSLTGIVTSPRNSH